jgi:hypothetical protein
MTEYSVVHRLVLTPHWQGESLERSDFEAERIICIQVTLSRAVHVLVVGQARRKASPGAHWRSRRVDGSVVEGSLALALGYILTKCKTACREHRPSAR